MGLGDRARQQHAQTVAALDADRARQAAEAYERAAPEREQQAAEKQTLADVLLRYIAAWTERMETTAGAIADVTYRPETHIPATWNQKAITAGACVTAKFVCDDLAFVGRAASAPETFDPKSGDPTERMDMNGAPFAVGVHLDLFWAPRAAITSVEQLGSQLADVETRERQWRKERGHFRIIAVDGTAVVRQGKPSPVLSDRAAPIPPAGPR